MTEEGKSSGFDVVYAAGAPNAPLPAKNESMIAEAVAAVKGVDVVVLALGYAAHPASLLLSNDSTNALTHRVHTCASRRIPQPVVCLR